MFLEKISYTWNKVEVQKKNLIEKGIVDKGTIKFYKDELIKYILNQVKTKFNRDYYRI